MDLWNIFQTSGTLTVGAILQDQEGHGNSTQGTCASHSREPDLIVTSNLFVSSFQ